MHDTEVIMRALEAVFTFFLSTALATVAGANPPCLCDKVAIGYSEDPITFPGEEIVTLIYESEIGVEGGACAVETRYETGTPVYYVDTYPSGEAVEIAKILFVNLNGYGYWLTLEEVDLIALDLCFGTT